MNLQLKVNLFNKIVEWSNENCEDVEIWPDAWFGNNTDKLMADAAASVFDAIIDIQDYLKAEHDLDK